MRVLITGNMGYVGSVLMRHLRENHPEMFIAGYDTGFFATQNVTDYLPERYIDAQYLGDIREFPDSLLEGIDTVVHLAAISNDPMGTKYESVTMDVNWIASMDLAKKAKKKGVSRFVFASSCSTYGMAGEQARKEDSPLNPLTAYARSKVLTERDLKGLADRKFVVTCLRFGTACGMSPRLRLDLVLNDFVASAILKRQIVILSDGSPNRPLIHVCDMARAIDWAVQREADNGGAYLVVNVGSQEWNFRIRDLAEAAARALPGVEVVLKGSTGPDRRSYLVDFGLFELLAPEHQPKFTLERAVMDLRDGMKCLGLDEDFRTSRYIRLRALDDLCDRGLIDETLRWTIQLPQEKTGRL